MLAASVRLQCLLLLLLLLSAMLSAAAAAADPAWQTAVASQLASLPPAAPYEFPPGGKARFLLYDILEHEQFNKQRKGMMFAYTIAQALGARRHRHHRRHHRHHRRHHRHDSPPRAFACRPDAGAEPAAGPGGAGREAAGLAAARGRAAVQVLPLAEVLRGRPAQRCDAALSAAFHCLPHCTLTAFSHCLSHSSSLPFHCLSLASTAIPTARSLPFPLPSGGPVGVIDFDEWAAAGLRAQQPEGGGEGGQSFGLEVVLHMVELFEGKTGAGVGMHDTDCPTDRTPRASPLPWAKVPAGGANGSNGGGGWAGTLYDVPGVPARTVRCVRIWGRLLPALAQYKDAESIALLNANFQLGYGYREHVRPPCRPLPSAPCPPSESLPPHPVC